MGFLFPQGGRPPALLDRGVKRYILKKLDSNKKTCYTMYIMNGILRKITSKFRVCTVVGGAFALLLFFAACGSPAPRDTSPPASITLAILALPNGGAEITWADPTTTDFSHILITQTPPTGNSDQTIRVEKNIERAMIAGLADGVEYTFTAVSVDNAGNRSPASASVRVIADATAPMPVGNLAATGGLSQITLTWTDPGDDDLLHILISWTSPVDNSPQSLRVGVGEQPITISPLAPGDYTFTVTTVDTVGHTTASTAAAASRSDGTPPGVVVLSAAAQANASVQVTWTDPSDADFSHIRLSWAPMGGNETQPLTITSEVETATVTGLTDGTEYTFTATSFDVSGNESAGSTGARVTADSTPPDVVVLTATAQANGSVQVTWTDPANADFSHILLSWTSVGGTTTPPLTITSEVETATINGLTDGTEYTFTAKSVDAAGNQSADSAGVQATANGTPPGAVVLSAAAQANGNAQVTWTDPDDTDFSHILLSWVTTGEAAQSVQINEGIGMATITGLTHGSTYSITAKSVDAAGNQSADSAGVQVTADAAVGPVTGLSAVTAANSTATLSWTNPSDADFSHLIISWTPMGGNPGQPLRFNSREAAATIAHLTPGSVIFTVQSVDTLGNTASETLTETIAPDTTAPAVVTLTATAQPDSAVQVTWTDPADLDYSHILLSWSPMGGAETQPLRIDSGTETTTITGLTDAVAYMFTAKSVDSTGNESDPSAAVTATADAGVSAVTNLAAVISGDSSVAVTWTDPADSDFTHVNLTWAPAASTETQPLRVAAGTEMAALTGLTGGTQYTITATAVDMTGNEAGAAATVTPVTFTTAAVTAPTASIITVDGSTTITWTDPDPADNIAKISITGVPGPTTAVEAALGAETANITGLTALGTEHVFSIATLDSSDAVTTVIMVTALTPASRPVALFRLGGLTGTSSGDFDYAACNNELTTDTGTVATAMRNAGYTEAVFFGSRNPAPGYDFVDLATDANALGVSVIGDSVLEDRAVVVYTDSNTPVSRFNSASRTIGDVVNVATDGEWDNNGYSVVDDLITNPNTDLFWSLTDNRSRSATNNCSDIRMGGYVGNSTGVGGPTIAGCNAQLAVLCAAH